MSRMSGNDGTNGMAAILPEIHGLHKSLDHFVYRAALCRMICQNHAIVFPAGT